MLHLGAEVLDDDIGLRRQGHEKSVTLRILQVDAQAPLVAMQVLFVGAAARTGHGAAHRRWRFDLDDVRTPVGKQPNSRRTGTCDGEIEDGVPGEGAVHGRLRGLENDSLPSRSQASKGLISARGVCATSAPCDDSSGTAGRQRRCTRDARTCRTTGSRTRRAAMWRRGVDAINSVIASAPTWSSPWASTTCRPLADELEIRADLGCRLVIRVYIDPLHRRTAGVELDALAPDSGIADRTSAVVVDLGDHRPVRPAPCPGRHRSREAGTRNHGRAPWQERRVGSPA